MVEEEKEKRIEAPVSHRARGPERVIDLNADLGALVERMKAGLALDCCLQACDCCLQIS